MSPRFVFLSLILIATNGVAATHAGDSVSIGFRKQLFVDDFVVAERTNLTRELGEVRKENGGQPVMRPDRPWEDPWHFGIYLTAMHRDGTFKLWYNVWQNAFGYAESEDGLNWHRPNLGIHGFQLNQAQSLGFRGAATGFTGKDNNITIMGAHAFGVFFDPHETDSQHQYKAAYGTGPRGDRRATLAHSPDGIHWTPYNDGHPVTGPAADTQNQVVWDEEAQVYWLHTRTDYRSDYSKHERIRGHRSMVNADLKANPANWITVRNWQFDREGPDEFLRRQIYSLTTWIHEGIYFGIISVYEQPDVDRKLRTETEIPDYVKRHEQDVMNFYIGTSRDGSSWNLDWVYQGKPFIKRGPNGSYDKDGIWPPSQIATWQDRHWIFYGGMNERHNILRRQMAIGLATLRRDRFVAMHAGEVPGSLVTKAFTLTGSRLELNVEAPEGELEVEVLDENGQLILPFRQSFARVDDLRLRPDWIAPSDLGSLKGRTVSLRFKLRNTRLYSFQIQP